MTSAVNVFLAPLDSEDDACAFLCLVGFKDLCLEVEINFLLGTEEHVVLPLVMGEAEELLVQELVDVAHSRR